MKNGALLLLVGILVGVSGCRGDASRCEDVCAIVDDCEGVSLDQSDCVDACTDDADNASDRCLEAFDDAADCASDNGLDCDEIEDGGECQSEAMFFLDDCVIDFEETFEEMGLIIAK